MRLIYATSSKFWKESRNFVKKPFNKKNFFPKKEKKFINNFVALADARSLTRRGKQCSTAKK